MCSSFDFHALNSFDRLQARITSTKSRLFIHVAANDSVQRVLEKFGYHLEAADDISWLMEWECGGHLVNIPQTMAMVPSDVLEAMLDSLSDISAEAFNSMAGN